MVRKISELQFNLEILLSRDVINEAIKLYNDSTYEMFITFTEYKARTGMSTGNMEFLSSALSREAGYFCVAKQEENIMTMKFINDYKESAEFQYLKDVVTTTGELPQEATPFYEKLIEKLESYIRFGNSVALMHEKKLTTLLDARIEDVADIAFDGDTSETLRNLQNITTVRDLVKLLILLKSPIKSDSALKHFYPYGYGILKMLSFCDEIDQYASHAGTSITKRGLPIVTR